MGAGAIRQGGDGPKDQGVPFSQKAGAGKVQIREV
jgi:hypothetical protein